MRYAKSMVRSQMLGSAVVVLALAAGCTPAPPPSPVPEADTQRPGPSPTASFSTSPQVTASQSPATASEAPQGWLAVVPEVQSGVGQFSVTTCDNSYTGTGFLITSTLVATAAHVVEDASAISVSFDGNTIRGVVLGFNELADLALVRLDSAVNGHQFEFQTTDPPMGTEVAALGFPRGESLTLTRGIVSGLDRDVNFGSGRIGNMIQTDAAINPGNSGGPLLGQDALVAGVVSAGKTGAEGMAYAVSGPRAAEAIAEWEVRGVPMPLVECGNAPAPESGYFPLIISSDHDQANNIGQSLLLHGQGINRGAYSAAFKQFTPELQATFDGAAGWSAELGSSYWQSLDVLSVSGSGNNLTADVKLRTIQSPEFGPQGQACSDWRIRYSMLWDGAAWRIAGSTLPFGQPTACL